MTMGSVMNPPAAVPWGHAPHDGPALWGSLDPAFRVCAIGREQSPIDLTGGRQADLAPIEFDYRRPASPSRTPDALARGVAAHAGSPAGTPGFLWTAAGGVLNGVDNPGDCAY